MYLKFFEIIYLYMISRLKPISKVNNKNSIVNDNITIDDVIKYQPKITKNQLIIGLANYKRDDDSIEDFDSFALRHLP